MILRTVSNLLFTRSAPFSLVHFITERCNARCSHCFINFGAPSPPSDELSINEIRQLVPTLGRQLYNVNITGGEPFLRDDLPEIIGNYATRADIKSLVITTNGWFTARTEELLKNYEALKSCCRLTISVSLDGPEAFHDKSRNLPGLFRKAMETCRLVTEWRDPRISLDIAITVTPWNREPLKQLYRQLEEEGLDKRAVPILMREQGIARLPSDTSEQRETYQWIAGLSGTARLRSTRSVGPVGSRIVKAVHNAKHRISHHMLAEPARYRRLCQAGSLFGVIAANGTVFPCEPLTMNMGNLREYGMDFQKLWHGMKAEQVRKQLSVKRCHCSYECAMTVNILSDPALLPKIALTAVKELL